MTDEIIADMERGDQSQLSSPGGKHGVAYAGGAQSGPISPPKDMPVQRLVRNNPERVSPKEFMENAQTGANTRKPRDRNSQSSIPPIPSNGSPHSRTPEHRRSPSYPLRTDSPQPYSHYDYSQGRVPTPSGLRKVETISPPSNSTKLSNSTPPLQSTKTKSPDRSLPLQEEPEDHHDDYGAIHHGSPTPSSDVYPEGRPGYDLKNRGGRDSAGRRVEDDDSATLNEDLSDEDDNHVPKPGQRDESSSSGFTPRSPSVALPDTNQRPDYHQSTLRPRPRGGVTDQLNMRGFEQMFDQTGDNVQRVAPNQTTPATTPTATANPPRIPPIAPPQNKDDKSAPQLTQGNQNHPGTVRQNQVQNAQRPQIATQPQFYPHHLYPEDFYDPTAAYLQTYLQSPGNRPQAPIPPTPHSQTTAPSPSPLVHLGPGGYDLEQHRNVGSPYPHPFSHVRRNAYTAARTPSIAYDPNDPNVIREQMALQMQIYALNNAAASSADSAFSPSSTSFPGPGYNPWAFVPTMRGFPGLGLGVPRTGDSTMSLRSSPSHEPVHLPLPPAMSKGPQSKLRKRERSTNLKAVQERLMNGGRSRSKLVPPRVDSTQPRDTSPEMSDPGEETAGEEVHTHVEGDAEKWDSNGVNGVGKEVEVKDVADAVQEIAGDVDDDADWIDQDEEDDDGNDLLDLAYHPSYVRDESKRRRRWENKWEALTEAVRQIFPIYLERILIIPHSSTHLIDKRMPPWFSLRLHHTLENYTRSCRGLSGGIPLSSTATLSRVFEDRSGTLRRSEGSLG